jgi:hypothetical protein
LGRPTLPAREDLRFQQCAELSFAARRYSPGVCIGAEKTWVMGDPDVDYVSTSHVERQNLTMRMGMRRFARLTNGFLGRSRTTRTRSIFTSCITNFCREHSTLTKAHQLHCPQTPAMSAGLTDHVWTLEEVCALLDTSRTIG